MKRRLFVAADLDDEARAVCEAVALDLRDRGWPGRWVPPENYHLTVAFLGAVDEERVAEVIDAVRGVAAGVPPVSVRLETAGAYPTLRRPRVAWVGSARPVPAFGTLCGVVRSALAALGFAFDRHADPHVTIARADGAAPLPAVAPRRAVTLAVASLRVYQSFTERAGARYEPLARVALDDSGDASVTSGPRAERSSS